MLLARLMQNVIALPEVVEPKQKHKRICLTLEQLRNLDSITEPEKQRQHQLLGGVVIAILGGGQLAWMMAKAIAENRPGILNQYRPKVKDQEQGGLASVVISSSYNDPAAIESDLHIEGNPNDPEQLAEIINLLSQLFVDKNNLFLLPDSDHAGVSGIVNKDFSNPAQQEYFQTITSLQDKARQFEIVKQVSVDDFDSILKPVFFTNSNLDSSVESLSDQQLLASIYEKMKTLNLSGVHFKVTRGGYDGIGIAEFSISEETDDETGNSLESLTRVFEKFDVEDAKGLDMWRNGQIAAFETIAGQDKEPAQNWSMVIASDTAGSLHFYPPVEIMEIEKS